MTARMHTGRFVITLLIGILAIINPAVSYEDENLVHFGDYPFVVSLRLHGRHYCAGAIIGPETILTSFYCAMGPYSTITVAAGTISSKHNDTDHLYEVTSKTYPLTTLAMLHLDRPLSFDHGVQPVAYAESLPQFVHLVGWGSLHRNPHHTVKYLHKAQLRTVPGDQCNQFWHLNVDSSESCGRAPRGTGLCGAVDGSPVVHDNKLVGIFQRGDACDSRDVPIFTNVFDLPHD